MKAVFFCPSVSVINGGIKHIFRMAEALIAEGHDAAVFEPSGQRPNWFASSAPIVGQGIFTATADHIYVLPEDQPQILADFARLPQRKVIYSQNHFYAALGIAPGASYADYGVTDILCSGRTIYEHCRVRYPSVNAHIIPCAVDAARFKPASPKRKMIAYMPRKRPVEAVYIRDMFCFAYPEYRDWEWHEIANVSETQAARLLGEAQVFLSLSRLEGFGLTPLEAMACGCVVAGFTGVGGREYASPQNGFWSNEDDFPACVDNLADAVDLAARSGADLQSYQSTCRRTIAAYTPETFTRAVKKVWGNLLNGG